MPFLSLVHRKSHPLPNIVFGVLYTFVMVLAIRGGWHLYLFYGLIEIALTVLIVWYAWTWPKRIQDHR